MLSRLLLLSIGHVRSFPGNLYRLFRGHVSTDSSWLCFFQSLVSLTYVKDVFHWARSSADISACSVEPGSVEDVGKIVRFILL